jgi:hypothetical protein
MPTLMQDEADVAALREAVPRSVGRMRFARPPRWFVLHGGPCDGLRVPLEEYVRDGWIIGWCTVTSTGPASALYDVIGASLAGRGMVLCRSARWRAGRDEELDFPGIAGAAVEDRHPAKFIHRSRCSLKPRHKFCYRHYRLQPGKNFRRAWTNREQQCPRHAYQRDYLLCH